MSELLILTKYTLANVTRAKWLFGYSAALFVLVSGLLFFGGTEARVAGSLLTLVLFIVPMISIFYATFYWYHTEPYAKLLLTQPIRRSYVFIANWIAVSCGLSGTFLIGSGLALAIKQTLDSSTLTVLLFGALLSFIFSGIGLLNAVLIADRMKGLGSAFLLWFYFSILHDVLVFAAASIFSEYPIETPAIALMIINPIDLARVHILMKLDLGAMMGYTGRILQTLLSSSWSLALTGLAEIIWAFLPVTIGVRFFRKCDL